jgi:hypothetical protein
MMKTLTSIALMTGCAIALAIPVGQAQTMDRHSLMGCAAWRRPRSPNT